MATDEVGNLAYDLEINSNNLDKQLDASDKKVEQFGKNVESNGQKIKDGLNKAAIALTTIGVGLTAYAKNATDFTVQTVKDSKALGVQLGISTTEASRLTAALGRMGIESAGARQMFGFLEKQIVATNEATDKSTTALGKLGIATKDAAGKNKDFNTILFEVADKFKAMPNGVEKSTMAMDLFGRQGKDMIKVLNLGSSGIQDLEKQADKLGLTLNEKTIGSVSKLVESQKALKQQTDSMKIAVGTLTAPVLTEFNKKLNEMLAVLISTDSPFRQITANVLAFGGPVATGAGGLAGFLANMIEIGGKVPGTGGLIGGISGAFRALGAALFGIPGLIALVVVATGFILQQMGSLQPMIDSVVQAWQTFIQLIGPVLAPMIQQIQASLVQLKPTIDFLVIALQAMAIIIGTIITVAIIGLIAALSALSIAVTFVAGVVTQAFVIMQNAVIGLGNMFLDIMWSMAQGAVRFYQSIVDNFSKAQAWFAALPANIQKSVGDLGNTLYNSGVSLINGFARGIQSAASNATKSARDVVNNIARLFPHSPAKEGPFSGKGWTGYSGMALMQDFADGILKNGSMPYDAISSSLQMPANSLSASIQSPGSLLASSSGSGTPVTNTGGNTTRMGDTNVTIGEINNTQDADYVLRRIDRNYELEAMGGGPA